MKQRLIALLFLALGGISLIAGVNEDFADKLAPLIDPARLATLKERGANPRVQKAVYWLAAGRTENAEPAKVLDAALRAIGMTNSMAAEMTKDALLRNLTIAERFGCLDEEGLAEMRKGHAPTVRRGPYAGDQLSVDHIVPRVVAPELDKVIANLELVPLNVNQRKNAGITQRQRALAERFHKAGLLSADGLNAVRKHR